jgi:Fic family protein
VSTRTGRHFTVEQRAAARSQGRDDVGVMQSAMSDEADSLYRPLGGLEPWAAVAVDEAAWAGALARLDRLREEAPDWSDMVSQGALVAAAHQSGALDGVHATSSGPARALLAGETTLASLDHAEADHVRANHQARRLAQEAEVSEASVLRIHEVACRPQLTHRVLVGARVQDHVLGGGEYKHHPNHQRTGTGDWRATAPVAQVRQETGRAVDTVNSQAFERLHPVTRAAYVHHALTHIQPFADGNGRVARALAGRYLFEAARIPLLVWADDAAAYEAAGTPAAVIGVVERAAVGLVDLLVALRPSSVALERWRAQDATARSLRAALGPAVEQALRRYRGGRADLSAATVAGEEPLVIGVPVEAGRVVEEVLAVDAHPLDGGPVLLAAREAQLRREAEGALGPWLDRVVSILALRVAAEGEEPVMS